MLEEHNCLILTSQPNVRKYMYKLLLHRTESLKRDDIETFLFLYIGLDEHKC